MSENRTELPYLPPPPEPQKGKKTKNRLGRELLFIALALNLCALIIETVFPFAKPFSFWWVIRNTTGFSGLIIIFAAIFYLTEPQNQQRLDK